MPLHSSDLYYLLKVRRLKETNKQKTITAETEAKLERYSNKHPNTIQTIVA